MKQEDVLRDDYSLRAADLVQEGVSAWRSTMSNIHVCYALLQDCPGVELDNWDGERIMLLPDNGVTLLAGTDELHVEEPSVLVIGNDIRISRVSGSGRVLLISGVQAGGGSDLPPRGVRRFSLADVTRDDSNFRVFRSAEFMLNVLKSRPVARDPSQLSPHSHADFEQLSFAMEGTYVHHLRWPWTKDMAQWREDQHIKVGSPSVCEIPRNVTHTSQNTGGAGWLVDIFHPLRKDFLDKPGLVVNADDYQA